MKMFYCLDRLVETNFKHLYAHMQREGISVQLISANCLITLFTWNSDLNVLDSPLMNLVWDSMILVLAV